MEGFQVTTMEEVAPQGDIFVTATGCCDIIRREHLDVMKHESIVCNIGHFDDEIEVAYLKNRKDIKRVNVKPQVDKFVYPDGKAIIVLAEGRLVNLGSDGTSVVRHVQQLHQSGAGPNRGGPNTGNMPSASTCCRRSWTKKSPGCTCRSWASS